SAICHRFTQRNLAEVTEKKFDRFPGAPRRQFPDADRGTRERLALSTAQIFSNRTYAALAHFVLQLDEQAGIKQQHAASFGTVEGCAAPVSVLRAVPG